MPIFLKRIFRFSLVLAFICGIVKTEAEMIPDEEVLVVDSDLANYDGKQCVLTGHVTVEHEIGALSAKQAIMIPAGGSEKGKLGNLQILGDVVFTLKEGGKLTCARANIDCQSLCGIFNGDSENAYVVYTDEGEDHASEKLLIVKGRQMMMAIERSKTQGTPHKSSFREITVDEDVTINYTDAFVAYGDHAVYTRDSSRIGTECSGQPLSGIVTLEGASPDDLCRVKTLRGDLIKARRIVFDTHSKQLSFSYPKGNLRTAEPDQKPVRFASDRMVWDNLSHLLTLSGNVQVDQGRLGNLNAEEEVRILQHTADGRKTISTIETIGHCVLSYTNEDKNLDHCLTCHGTIKIDHIKMEAWLFSPKNQQGVVAEGKQIHLDDIKGEIFADKAFITYQLVNGETVPSKVILGGNVRILNTLTRHEDGTTTALQYAIADQVEYIPHSSEMLFKGNSGRRVLFFDRTNNLQVSAPSLKITRGAANGKEIVQGYGDVRFSFIEHEFEQLRKRFAFDKSNPALPLK